MADAGAYAVEPIKISTQDTALDLSKAVEIFHTDKPIFQTSAAPGPDGIVRRIEVQANSSDYSGNWGVFTLANPTDEQIDRLIVAPHYRMAGSGLLHPDLGSVRIVSITPSEGFALDKQASMNSDVFRVTLNPGSVITFVLELGSDKLPQLYLWAPEAYKDTLNSYTLYHGILLGIAGLLALLVTVLFIIRGTSLFPATAAIAWAALAYIGIDFNFFNKLFVIAPTIEPIWRALTEVALAASLFIFLFIYLNLNRWHYRFNYGAIIVAIALLFLAAFAIFDPVDAAGIARLSFGITVGLGVILIGYFSLHGYDRAVMLVPTWLLLILWIFCAYICITGQLDNDIIQPALAGGLVLIVLLISFTVMQKAFPSGSIQEGLFSDLERQAFAIMGAGDVVWDWDVRRNRVSVNPDLSIYLGSAAAKLYGKIRDWRALLHIDDQDRFYTLFDMVLESRKGRIDQTFRLRSGDGHYHWFTLKARPVVGIDGEIIRIVGILSNITEHKKAQERLLHDSIYDNLTDLPNQQLFLDRLKIFINLARSNEQIRPTVLIIDFDGFGEINRELGMTVGDIFLLTIARRIGRLIKIPDTLSRLSADRFALILLSKSDAVSIAQFVEHLHKIACAPINLPQREIDLSASVGLVTWSETYTSAEDMLNDAELAMIYARRDGGNKIQPFRPNLRQLGHKSDNWSVDILSAIQRDEIKVLYHPVLNLVDGRIVGFESIVEWHHPHRGVVNMHDFINAAESEGAAMPLAQFVMDRVVNDLADLTSRFAKQSFFISVNIPSSEMVHPDLISGLRSILTRNPIHKGQLMVEMSEAVLLENPARSTHLLEQIKSMGLGLVLDNFGTGYSSLAYLLQHSFDMIKLDRSILSVKTIKEKVILRSIIAMAHELELKVVAEGVENEEEAIFLREQGCEFVQSMVFTHPLNVEELAVLIVQHPKSSA
ncbi:EAL domain-containing protein [Bartonella sp. DGB2]|uniref:EAL domain-containing protein n=1 Tax=Bartonella sp. DGB2 TaxID=3388426 RepID=UPI0039903500